MPFEHINATDTQQKLASDDAVLVDIRDPQSFAQGHIDGAIHLNNDTVGEFVQRTDASTPVIVCCYHGISSQQAAEFLIQQGFSEVYSLDGGFEGWRMSYPFVSSND